MGTLYHVKQNEYDMEKKFKNEASVKASEAAEEEAKRRYPNSSIKVADMIVHYEEWEQLAFIAGTQWGKEADHQEALWAELIGYVLQHKDEDHDWSLLKSTFTLSKQMI